MRTGFISRGGRIDTFHNHQSNIFDENQCRFHVAKITHGQAIIVNIIDKDVTCVVITHAEMNL